MDASDDTGRPATTQESLFRAAEALEQATAAARDTDTFLHDAHDALRRCVVAARHETPRLRPALEKLEADLARCLVEVWEAKSASLQPSDELIGAMNTLAAHVRAAASEEFDLVHEMERPMGAQD